MNYTRYIISLRHIRIYSSKRNVNFNLIRTSYLIINRLFFFILFIMNDITESLNRFSLLSYKQKLTELTNVSCSRFRLTSHRSHFGKSNKVYFSRHYRKRSQQHYPMTDGGIRCLKRTFSEGTLLWMRSLSDCWLHQNFWKLSASLHAQPFTPEAGQLCLCSLDVSWERSSESGASHAHGC